MHRGNAGAEGHILILARGDSWTDYIQWCQDIASDVIMGAIEPALHHDDMISTGGATRETNRGHGGFGPGIEDLHHLADFDVRAHQFGEPTFERIGTAATKAGAVLQNLFHRRIHAAIV